MTTCSWIICIREGGDEGRLVMDIERERYLSWQDPRCVENRENSGGGVRNQEIRQSKSRKESLYPDFLQGVS